MGRPKVCLRRARADYLLNTKNANPPPPLSDALSFMLRAEGAQDLSPRQPEALLSLEATCCFKVGLRPSAISAAPISNAAIGVGRRILRIEVDGLGKVGNRALVLLPRPIHQAAIVEGF